jgi:para-nitrobenzyl esterase
MYENLFSRDPSLPEDIVKTKFGYVKGKLYDSYRVFRGLPYALPPVGELRFRPTESWNITWDGIRDATVR